MVIILVIGAVLVIGGVMLMAISRLARNRGGIPCCLDVWPGSRLGVYRGRAEDRYNDSWRSDIGALSTLVSMVAWRVYSAHFHDLCAVLVFTRYPKPRQSP